MNYVCIRMERRLQELLPRMRKVVIIQTGHEALAIRITATGGKVIQNLIRTTVELRV